MGWSVENIFFWFLGDYWGFANSSWIIRTSRFQYFSWIHDSIIKFRFAVFKRFFPQLFYSTSKTMAFKNRKKIRNAQKREKHFIKIPFYTIKFCFTDNKADMMTNMRTDIWIMNPCRLEHFLPFHPSLFAISFLHISNQSNKLWSCVLLIVIVAHEIQCLIHWNRKIELPGFILCIQNERKMPVVFLLPVCLLLLFFVFQIKSK